MTVKEIQTALFNRFLTLADEGVKVTDSMISYPNKSFTKPSNNRFYILNVMFNDLETYGTFKDAPDLASGIFQVEIATPLNVGEEESLNKYEKLCKVFKKGSCFNDIYITKTPTKTNYYQDDYFSTIVRINFETLI